MSIPPLRSVLKRPTMLPDGLHHDFPVALLLLRSKPKRITILPA